LKVPLIAFQRPPSEEVSRLVEVLDLLKLSLNIFLVDEAIVDNGLMI
jgi:hypothetical protein